MSDVINMPEELINLRGEFRDSLEFVGDVAESHACIVSPVCSVKAANIQHSTSEYSLITGLSDQSIPVDGGQWLPALVFIPYT